MLSTCSAAEDDRDGNPETLSAFAQTNVKEAATIEATVAALQAQSAQLKALLEQRLQRNALLRLAIEGGAKVALADLTEGLTRNCDAQAVAHRKAYQAERALFQRVTAAEEATSHAAAQAGRTVRRNLQAERKQLAALEKELAGQAELAEEAKEKQRETVRRSYRLMKQAALGLRDDKQAEAERLNAEWLTAKATLLATRRANTDCLRKEAAKQAEMKAGDAAEAESPAPDAE